MEMYKIDDFMLLMQVNLSCHLKKNKKNERVLHGLPFCQKSALAVVCTVIGGNSATHL